MAGESPILLRIGSQTLSLDQLVALNDEMAALVRAGVPLPDGLAAFGRDTPGRLGETALRVAQRLQSGETLERILTAEDSTFPAVWRAVVAAGIRAGNLGAALEGLAATGRRLAELRRTFKGALVYPLVVASLAVALCLFTLTQLVPALAEAHRQLVGSPDALLQRFTEFGRSARYWGGLLPLVGMLVAGYVWRRTWRSSGTFSLAASSPWPVPRSMIHGVIEDSHLAMFAEVLALLIRHEVPLADALRLAAGTSGNGWLRGAAARLAEHIEGGECFTPRNAQALRFPPLLGWLISTGSHDAELPATLAAAAERYRQRAARRLATCRVVWPLVATVTLGGGAVLLQTVALWVPLSRLLFTLSAP